MSSSPDNSSAQTVQSTEFYRLWPSTLNNIASRDLHTSTRTYSETHQYKCSAFSWIDADDHVYFGTIAQEQGSIQAEDLRKVLKLVEDRNVYPQVTSRLSVFSMPVQKYMFVKRPQIHWLERPNLWPKIKKLFLDEAEVLQQIMDRPHPNLPRYYGCTVKRGHVTGLILQRYPMTMEVRLGKAGDKLNVEKCFADIEAGVTHLHYLGLAHNDLKPENIMIDEHDNPIIIDFGSCKPFNHFLTTTGSPGWVADDDEEYYLSKKEHDEFALIKLQQWLNHKGRLSETFSTF